MPGFSYDEKGNLVQTEEDAVPEPVVVGGPAVPVGPQINHEYNEDGQLVKVGESIPEEQAAAVAEAEEKAAEEGTVETGTEALTGGRRRR